MTIRILAAVGLTLAIMFEAVTSLETFAQSFPSRRITLTVPFPPGSATDGVTRRLAESIQNQAGVTALVENKPGADGNLAALSVLKADADGYNVFVTTNSTHAANVNLFKAMPFDPKADFSPVAGIMSIPLLLTVKDDFPARSVAEFIALSRASARTLLFGSGNTSSRGAAELFRHDAGIEMQHVPYRGMPQALTDLLSGQIDCVFADPASAQGLIQDHRLRVLAVTSGDRLASLPDVPTMKEVGLHSSELTAWVGVFARSGTPPDVVDRLNRLVATFLDALETRRYLESVGAKPFLATPAELGAFADADTKRWAQIVEIAKIEKK